MRRTRKFGRTTAVRSMLGPYITSSPSSKVVFTHYFYDLRVEISLNTNRPQECTIWRRFCHNDCREPARGGAQNWRPLMRLPAAAGRDRRRSSLAAMLLGRGDSMLYSQSSVIPRNVVETYQTAMSPALLTLIIDHTAYTNGSGADLTAMDHLPPLKGARDISSQVLLYPV